MIKLYSLLLSLLFIGDLLAQVPDKFSFQAVVRNTSSQLVVNQLVGVRISILFGSSSGSVVFAETHVPMTNAQGLFSIQIGTGNNLIGNLGSIDWSSGIFFIKSEIDLDGNTNYTIQTNQQLASVPYAFYCNDVPSSVSQSGDTLFIGNSFYIIPGISAANQFVPILTSDHTCGEHLVHNSNKTYGTLIDQQGNSYKTIVIGSQTWMAENLKTSIYRNGDPILTLTPPQWASTNSGAWMYYENNQLFECPYGKIYNWYTVLDSRNVCPTGWHVPTIDEWFTLRSALGGEFVAGGKMKSTGLDHWLDWNESATNESGLSVLPGGSANSDASTYFLGQDAYFWSSSPVNVFVVSGFKLYSTNASATEIQNPRNEGMSIRCVHD